MLLSVNAENCTEAEVNIADTFWRARQPVSSGLGWCCVQPLQTSRDGMDGCVDVV
jgi:hypothetical protein